MKCLKKISENVSGKKANHLLILSFLFLLIISPPVMAKTFQVCTVDIPNGMTADGEGPQPLLEFYNEVIKDVSNKTGHKFELRFAPAERCSKLFYTNQIDILWPFIIAEDAERVKALGATELPLYSMPIIMGGFYIYNRKEDAPINDVKSLEGKSVVSARGYGIPQAMEHNERIAHTLTNTNDLVPKMILGERVDAGIIQTGWVPILEKQGLLDGLHHGELIDFWGGSFVFHFTQEGAELNSSFSTSILQLVVNGTYQDLVTDAPYFIPAYQAKP